MDSVEVENAEVEARPVGVYAARPSRVRLYAALLLAACATLLGLAAWLKPNPAGLGTHRQLGFGRCGMLVTTGYPCPTCGDDDSVLAYRARTVATCDNRPTGWISSGTGNDRLCVGIALDADRGTGSADTAPVRPRRS